MNGIQTTHIESGDFLKQFPLVLNRLPELDKVTLLKNVSHVNDFLHRLILHLTRQQEIFAENKVAVWQIRECLQQNQMSHGKIESVWIELIILQHGEIGIQIVCVILCLLLDILFEKCKMHGIVSGKKCGFG